MISGFNRSISLPMSPKSKLQARYHVWSVSLPSHSHPLISHLGEQIRAFERWAARSDGSCAWIEAGLSQIELLQLALNDFLNLTETKNVLRRGTASTENILDDLLCLVDLYGSFLSAIVTLKQQIFEVQSALRRCDSNRLASSLKSQKKTEKELSRLASSLRASMKQSPAKLGSDANHATESEIMGILKEAICSTSTATAFVFNIVIVASTATSTAAASLASNRILPFTKKISKEDREIMSYQKLEELENLVRIVDSGSEKVFRSLINCRVSLLNIQSDSL